LVVVSDVNKKGIMMFSRSVEPSASGVVEPKRYIIGSLENSTLNGRGKGLNKS
jgi:hypothetical protein